MADNKKPLTDEEIVASLRGSIKDTIQWTDATLAAERLSVQEYYDGDKPVASHKGNSKYVSVDVYDSVENMKALLLETFAGGYQIVEFEPNGKDDVEQARIATAYVDQVVFRDNDGYGTFRSAIHDGLMARIGVAKVWWEEDYDNEEETFERVPHSSLAAFIQNNPDAELKDVETHADEDNDGEEPTVSGTLVRKINKSGVRIKEIPPENFMIEGRAKNLKEAFVSHREEYTKSDLYEMFDKDIVDGIAIDDESAWQDDPEVVARFEGIGNDLKGYSEEMQDLLRKTWVYECYVDLAIDGTNETKLWKFTLAGNTLLDKEEITRKPFILWAPIPKPHSIYGVNYADKVIPTQNAKTVLTRSILDHTVQTTNPRFTVLKGSLMNPRELMDNRVGGVVNITRPDSVQPLAQAPLNPFVFQSIQLLDADLEDTTGVSRLSQGLNKDVLSKQNSQQLVQDVMQAGQGRQKIIARNFANEFVRPLFCMVYDLVLENEDRQRIINVAGNWVPVDPSKWKPRERLRIEFKLGAGEQDKEAQEWLMVDQIMSANPTTLPLYGLEQKRNVLVNYLMRKGVKDVDNYLKPAQQAMQEQKNAPPPMELQLAQMQQKMQQMELQMQSQLQQMHYTNQHAEKMGRLNLEAQKAQGEFALHSDKQDLAEREQDHKEEVDAKELEIMQQTADQKAIVTPPRG